MSRPLSSCTVVKRVVVNGQKKQHYRQYGPIKNVGIFPKLVSYLPKVVLAVPIKSWLLKKKKKKTEASSHFSGMKDLLHSGLVGGKKIFAFFYLKNHNLKQRFFTTYQTTVQQLLHATKMRRGFGLLLLLQKPRFITTKILIYVVPTPFFMETLTHLRTAECKGIKHENRLVYLPGYLFLLNT